MIGLQPSWHTTNLPTREIAIKVGDAVFLGLWKLLLFYFLASMAVLLLLIQFIGPTPLYQQKPSVLAAVWSVCALVPGVLLFLWVSRRPRAHASDSGGTGPQ
jgi:hypothetical protein